MRKRVSHQDVSSNGKNVHGPDFLSSGCSAFPNNGAIALDMRRGAA
jgi:hypothetical protein